MKDPKISESSERWLVEHRDRIKGVMVAIHPTQGIVASAPRGEDVYAEVERLRLLSEVQFISLAKDMVP